VGAADAGDFKVRDLPDAAGQMLVDAGVAVAAVERVIVGEALDVGQRSDDGYLTAQLDVEVGEVEAGNGGGAGAHTVELLGLGEDVAVGGDAEVVVGEKLVHCDDVVGELGGAPLAFERDDLVVGDMFVVLVVAVMLRHK